MGLCGDVGEMLYKKGTGEDKSWCKCLRGVLMILKKNASGTKNRDYIYIRRKNAWQTCKVHRALTLLYIHVHRYTCLYITSALFILIDVPQTDGQLQSESIDIRTKATHLRFVIDSSYDHFVSVHKLSVVGNPCWYV